MNTQQYSSLISYAWKCINNHKHDLTLSAHDLVADAFLSVGSFNKEAIIRHIIDQIHAEARQANLFVPFVKSEWSPNKKLVFETSRFCKDCGQDKPLNAFRLVRRKEHNIISYRADCRECENAKSRISRREKYQKLKADPIKHEAFKAYQREWSKRYRQTEKYKSKPVDIIKRREAAKRWRDKPENKLKQAEKDKLRVRDYSYRLKDPKYKEIKNKYEKKRRTIVKDDAEKYALYLEKQRAYNKNWREKIKLENPDKYKKIGQKGNEFKKDLLQNIKNQPDKYEAYLSERREQQRLAREKKKRDSILCKIS